MLRRLVRALLLMACVLVSPLAPAQTTTTVENPLAPLATWVGGRWVGEFDAGNGRKFKAIRVYEWSFDQRLLFGRSFGEFGGRTVQTRETVYFWNPATKRIEFTDFLDKGGFGAGFIERRDGRLYMEAQIIGNAEHPAWRAWIDETPDRQVIRVEALKDGKMADFGTYPYQREAAPR
jgi:hypothetical protein